MSVIDIPELHVLFTPDDFTGDGAIVVAVSGGGDSLALLFLLQQYLQSRGEAARLVAVTVDHGLRAESAVEAAGVAALCARHGIVHRTLCWQGEKPQSGLARRARTARYDLLCQAAEDLGAGVIVTGHTLDDQAETYIMRLQRDQAAMHDGEGGGRGLAAMPRLAVLQRKFRLLRPLLSVRRGALRQYLQARNIGWVDDPGNDNPSSERVRVRRQLDDAAISKAQAAVVCARGRRAGRARMMAALVEQNRVRLCGERLWLARNGVEEAAAAFYGLVMTCAAIIGGREQVPACTARVQHLLEAGDGRITVAGAVIEVTRNSVRLWREKRNLAEVALAPGDKTVWDGRYRIANNSGAPVTLRTPEHDELRAVFNNTPADDTGLHWPSLETTCALERKGRVVLPVLQGVPAGVTIERILRPFDWLVADSERSLLAALQPVFAFKA
ncbi:MAG: Hypothetical protein BHV28_02750 [Candidatus Tokpelaia hoelldobleri]|uniref:tRNA(Ile)-lysidine synthase n=1 Tax=Candidatus Tokpelaia hoelldobleri TaxID=1902579 RepID=A0A1U9JT18_9HYPH|nr:MAG: Hypothetical protein BHV28_02750 [Candidatus Tokpelaia hoelldoblerii]